MKKLYILICLFFLFSCSKEKQQQQQENLILQAMVSGQWKVTNFTKAGADITSDFEGYKFQFKNNFTVEALYNGSIEKTGDWNADPVTQTITSNFTNAPQPLILLNGTWSIEKTTWTSVQANQTVNGELCTLRLDKQ